MFKKDFPIFKNKDIVYLDSASSTQKPAVMIEALRDFYENTYSNVHRGTCSLAACATERYEQARKTVADLINMRAANIVFTKGATESLNLIAVGLAQHLTPGDEILIYVAEHHANFVPWQQIALKTGAVFNVFDVREDGSYDTDDFARKLNAKTKIVALSHMSNVLGVVNPLTHLIDMAHAVHAVVVVDCAQSIAHMPVDARALNADFLVFSGHKLYGPTGIGILAGTDEMLDALPPYQFGGDMVRSVRIKETDFAAPPVKFEAGTPPFAEAIALSESITYVRQIGFDKIMAREHALMNQLLNRTIELPNVHILAPNPNKESLVAMTFGDIHPTDIAALIARQGICVRVGHHCAMPIHERFKTPVSLRVSLGIYNNADDIERFCNALEKALRFFKG